MSGLCREDWPYHRAQLTCILLRLRQAVLEALTWPRWSPVAAGQLHPLAAASLLVAQASEALHHALTWIRLAHHAAQLLCLRAWLLETGLRCCEAAATCSVSEGVGWCSNPGGAFTLAFGSTGLR